MDLDGSLKSILKSTQLLLLFAIYIFWQALTYDLWNGFEMIVHFRCLEITQFFSCGQQVFWVSHTFVHKSWGGSQGLGCVLASLEHSTTEPLREKLCFLIQGIAFGWWEEAAVWVSFQIPRKAILQIKRAVLGTYHCFLSSGSQISSKVPSENLHNETYFKTKFTCFIIRMKHRKEE